MTTSQQKDIELEQLKKALKLLGITSYEVIEKDNESPDTIVRVNGQSIGVEITELHRNLGEGVSAKTESDLPKIVNEALAIYNQYKGKPFLFGFGFNGKVAIRNRKHISQYLGQFLLEQSKQLPNEFFENYKITPDKTKHPLLDIINFIHVFKSNEENAVGFTTSCFDSIPVEHCILESRIKEKTELLSKYRQQCEIIWLLITLPYMKLAGDFKLPDTEFTSQYKGFDAIYVLDDYRDEIRCIHQTALIVRI